MSKKLRYLRIGAPEDAANGFAVEEGLHEPE